VYDHAWRLDRPALDAGKEARVPRAIRLLALWGNLLYAAIAATIIASLLGAAGGPAGALVMHVVMLALAAATGALSVWVLRRRGAAVTMRTLALAGQLFWLGYVLTRPEYAHVALEAVVAMVPLLNISVIGADCLRSAGARRSVAPDDLAGRMD
jgi:hypothetical protein